MIASRLLGAALALMMAAAPVYAATYVVQEGDVLGTIAEKQLGGASRWQEILKLNREHIPNPDNLPLGLNLILPDGIKDCKLSNSAGKAEESEATEKTESPRKNKKEPEATNTAAKGGTFPYTVVAGDSLSGILSRFHLDRDTFLTYNHLEDLDSLSTGQKLLIPASHDRFRPRNGFKQAHRGLLGDVARLIGRKFCWPLFGAISSGFGFRGESHFHTGVDIPRPAGSPIHAAKDGVVVRAENYAGYGKVVDIRHADGLLTRYAHCSKLLVHRGENVNEGDTIALVGSTGRATTAHLHFEIRLNDRPIDPEKFKPKG